MIVYSGADDIVWAVARTGPDGGQFAALTDKGLFIWQRGNPDAPLFLPAENEGRVHAKLVVSPDGEWMASHGAGKLWCWHLTGKGWALHSHVTEPALCTARFTATAALDSVVMREGKKGTVELHQIRRRFKSSRAATDRTVAVFPAPEGVTSTTVLLNSNYYTVDLSSDGNLFLLSPSEQFQYLWNTGKSRLIGAVKMRSYCNEAAISPDGTMFAVDSGTSVYLYRSSDLNLLGTWKVKHCLSPQLAWSPDSRRLARADSSTTVRQFDRSTGAEVTALGMRGHRATSIAYSPDGLTYLAGTFKGNVVAWDAE